MRSETKNGKSHFSSSVSKTCVNKRPLCNQWFWSSCIRDSRKVEIHRRRQKKNKQFQMPHYKTSVRFDLQWISCALNRIWLVTCHHSNGMLIDEICLEATKHGLCHENERESVTKTVFFFSGFHSICISWINRKSEYKKKRSCTLILKQDVVWIALD